MNFKIAKLGQLWLEQRPPNLEVASLNPPGAWAFFSSSSFNGSVLNQVPQERNIFAVFPFKKTLAVLPEGKQD